MWTMTPNHGTRRERVALCSVFGVDPDMTNRIEITEGEAVVYLYRAWPPKTVDGLPVVELDAIRFGLPLQPAPLQPV